MAEDPQPLTLRERIQALNTAHIGRTPGDPPRPSSRPPPIPAKRPVVLKQHTINYPLEKVHGSITDSRPGNLPAAPPPARKQPPPLPSRNSSLEEQRRGSVASTNSSGTSDTISTKASTTRTKSTESVNRVKAPAWGECQLPALPPRNPIPPPAPRTSDEQPRQCRYSNRVASGTAAITPETSTHVKPTSPPRPSLPPRRSTSKHDAERREPSIDAPVRKMPPMPSIESMEKAKRAAFGYNTRKEVNHQESVAVMEPVRLPIKQAIPPPVRQYPVPLQSRENVSIPPWEHSLNHQPYREPSPPPIPVSSRPDLSAIQATKPKSAAASPTLTNGHSPPASNICLVCRDFSGPDHQATLFPRSRVSSLQSLALQLTSPFSSPTDKARAIFTWLHHNIAYDVISFFNHNVRGSTPQSTLQSGLAVCEGYAALFTNLATYAGLESVVISGHGKGFGFANLAPGAPLPPYNAGHAWSAVRIDDGEWKLIDPCWGAGHIQGAGQPYVKSFHSECFTMSNEEFGIKHFPGNKDQFFLPGGRRMSWEEYIVIDPASWPDMVEPPTIFTNGKEDYFINEKQVYPRARKINVRQPGTVRFQFGLRCAHWTLERHTTKGPPPVFLVSVGGVDRRNKDLIPMEYYAGPAGQGGDLWSIDISARELGAPGQPLMLFAVTSFGDRQDCRGLTVEEFRDGKGRVGMGFVGVASWDLV